MIVPWLSSLSALSSLRGRASHLEIVCSGSLQRLCFIEYPVSTQAASFRGSEAGGMNRRSLKARRTVSLCGIGPRQVREYSYGDLRRVSLDSIGMIHDVLVHHCDVCTAATFTLRYVT